MSLRKVFTRLLSFAERFLVHIYCAKPNVLTNLPLVSELFVTTTAEGIGKNLLPPCFARLIAKETNVVLYRIGKHPTLVLCKQPKSGI
jgi:hypothetical protein